MRIAFGLRTVALALAILIAALAVRASTGVRQAQAAAPHWRLEQPAPPSPPAGVPGASTPIALGHIGDIEFWAPDRGLLITEGNPPHVGAAAIPAGIWAYNGLEWHELASVCGASTGPITSEASIESGRSGLAHGSIVWAGPGEFWTVSDGRAGQSPEKLGTGNEQLVAPPLEDNTLCHFVGGQLVASYAHLAFEADSYAPMNAAICLNAADCWFGGYQLEPPELGAFQLHWDGGALDEEPALGESLIVEGLSPFAERVYESVRSPSAAPGTGGSEGPPPLWRSAGGGRFEPEGGRFGAELIEPGGPIYADEEPRGALEAMKLAPSGEKLWAAAGKGQTAPVEGQVTVLVGNERRVWKQIIGWKHPLCPILQGCSGEAQSQLAVEERALLGLQEVRKGVWEEARQAAVASIAAEPGTEDAWVALAPRDEALSVGNRSVLLHVSASGGVLEEQTLPSNREEEEGVAPKGAAAKLSCPQANDCWLATSQGWLYHLAPEGQSTLGRDPHESEYFDGLVTYRPPDQGLPQILPDAPPANDSGISEEVPEIGQIITKTAKSSGPRRERVPLISDMRSKVIRHDVLELRFRLAVKARVRLLAKRRNKVVAATRDRTLKAGRRRLLLRLNVHRWPTKLALRTHALASLPTRPAREGTGVAETISTGAYRLPRTPSFAAGADLLQAGSLPL